MGNAPGRFRHFQTQTEQKFGVRAKSKIKTHQDVDLVLKAWQPRSRYGLIRFTCEQWEELRDQYPSLTDQPSA